MTPLRSWFDSVIIALLFIAVLSVLAPLNASAAYFRLIDPNNPVKVAGAYIDAVNPGQTSYGTAVALVTHSVQDGCQFPSIACLDWSPAMAGLSYNAGRFQFNIGPAWNLTPLVKASLFGILDTITNDDQLVGLKSTLSSQPISGPDVSTSFGPALNVSPIERGIVLPLSQWKGRVLIFAGAALKFK